MVTVSKPLFVRRKWKLLTDISCMNKGNGITVKSWWLNSPVFSCYRRHDVWKVFYKWWRWWQVIRWWWMCLVCSIRSGVMMMMMCSLNVKDIRLVSRQHHQDQMDGEIIWEVLRTPQHTRTRTKLRFLHHLTIFDNVTIENLVSEVAKKNAFYSILPSQKISFSCNMIFTLYPAWKKIR